jgi:hypothetical protein
MKWITMLTLALVIGSFGTAFADCEADANAEVFVEVEANIAIVPVISAVDMYGVQTGTIEGCVEFRVDANTQTCQFFACATELYKGDIYSEDPDVPPIPLLESAGIDFSAPEADPTGGEDGNEPYTACGACDEINGWPAWCTDWIEFESAQNNHFSQSMTICVTWIQDDDEKPMGEYSGYVALYGMIVLPA